MKYLKEGFTLAEVLITLAIIGVVAALTIPALISKMSQHAAEARQKTIEARLLDGINRYSAMEDGLSQHYETTYDFLVGLSKYYKMSQICRADEITNCIPYSSINYVQAGEERSVEVSALTNVNAFIEGRAANNYLSPASFITSGGTPMIIALKKDCVWDMGKAMMNISDSGCIAYMYDENGTQKPNKIGRDWVGHGLTIAPQPIAVINGIKIMEKAFMPSVGLTKAECLAEATPEKQAEYGDSAHMVESRCTYDNDRWAYAMKYCHDKGWRLPLKEEAQKIAQGLYKNRTTGEHDLSATSGFSEDYVIDINLVSTTLGLKSRDKKSITEDNVNSFTLDIWRGAVIGQYAPYTLLNSYKIEAGSCYNSEGSRQVLCISD